MNYKGLFYTDIEPCEKSELQISMLKDNIRRTKIFSLIVIVFELILAVSDVITSMLKVDDRFHFSNYLIAYLIMIFVNILFLIYINKADNIKDKPIKYLNRFESLILAYITFILCWGSIISLMDQKLYGQLMVFMVNMIVCSVLYYIDNKKILLPFISSTLILLVGLPLFQRSSDVLIGHYINLIIFVIIAFICSRIIFYNYCHDFKNKMLLKEANKKLQDLSYFDDLTCLPNRRSFNNYIDLNYRCNFKSGSIISVIMMDIDFFKQYNDNYGHFAGDKILVAVAEQIRAVVTEKNDFAARIGGEEFIYVAANTDSKQITEIAEVIRCKIIDLKIPHEYSEHNYLSISLGLSTTTLGSEVDIFKCIENADNALYNAKIKGRNCIKIKL